MGPEIPAWAGGQEREAHLVVLFGCPASRTDDLFQYSDPEVGEFRYDQAGSPSIPGTFV